MGQIQYTQITDKQCCYGSSNKVYNIPVGATIHEIATITGATIEKAAELQELLLQESTDCDIFYSAEIEEQVQKNNCSVGRGTVVTITSPERQFSSQISQADADAKAREYFDANKQRIANQQGDCTTSELTFTSAAIEEDIRKNNCSIGTGSIETVSLAAGLYSSTISQTDADQKAQDYFDSVKQQLANTQGECIEADCLDCTNYRVVSSVECGEYRVNTKCENGNCLDTSSEYFVCLGNCKGEQCVEECTQCSFSCLTGECQAGYICERGQCVKDCTGQPCSFECPDNDTGDACTECVDGLEATIDCAFGEICENGVCCVTEDNTKTLSPCCSGLFEFEGKCVSDCPEGYTREGNNCLFPNVCSTSISETILSLNGVNKKEYTYKVLNSNATTGRINISNEPENITSIVKVFVNNTLTVTLDCNSTIKEKWFRISFNDIIKIEVTWNCTDILVDNFTSLGTVGFLCTRYQNFLDSLYPISYPASISREIFSVVHITDESANLEFRFNGLGGGNSFQVSQNLVSVISTSTPDDGTSNPVINNILISPNQLIIIDVQPRRSSSDDSTADNGETYNGWTLEINKIS